MRQIKFRGKRTDTGEWIYGSLLMWENGDSEIMVQKSPVDCDKITVDADTVGQFTGLLDKNGKEIYEGDIILESTDGINTDWKIRYDIGLSQYRAENIGDECDDIQLNAVWIDRSEVIGTIHDNPELLKGGKE